MLILVPVKRFDVAKSRLAEALDAVQRASLAAWMLDRVLVAARDAYPSARIVLVGDEPAAAPVAARHRAGTFPETGNDLNTTLAGALAGLRAEAASPAIVVASDLPRATPCDLRALSSPTGAAGLVPSHDGDGTNAVWIPASAPFRPAFGAGSRSAHRAMFAGAGWPVVELALENLARDVDTVADLHAAAREIPDWPLGSR
jgi:2-phospho-L-lactate guanylyltransferase